MGTVNGGTIISFTPTPSLHAVTSRMPSHHPTGCANFTFQIPSIANSAKKNTNSAERRANHNAVERARRECLNTKFQELAHALPSLAQVRRPSKSIIVQKSLEFIYNARKKDEEMRSIRNENELLRKEVNKLREQLGMEPLPPSEESKSSSTSQQADEAEDAKISSKNSNISEIKIEADNQTTTTNNSAQESTSSIDIGSVDIQVKTEGFRSDDDLNSNTEEDYEMEASEMIDGKSTEINQPIDNNQPPPCMYDDLMYPASLLDPSLNQHSFPTSSFGFAMDMPIDHHQIVDPNSLHLQFDPDQLRDDLSAFCDPFPSLQPKFYPSPPYEMLEINHMPYSTMSTDNSHM